MRSTSLRALTVGAILSLGAGAVGAQPPAASTRPPAAGEQRGRTQQGVDGWHRRGGRGPGARGEGRLQGALFRDITLTDAQRTQLREVRQRYATQRRQLLGDARPGAREGSATEQRQRPDSAARAQRRARLDAARGQVRQLSERQLADVRALLTAEQRTTFDRNVTRLRERQTARGGQRRDGRGRGAAGRGGQGGRPAPRTGAGSTGA